MLSWFLSDEENATTEYEFEVVDYGGSGDYSSVAVFEGGELLGYLGYVPGTGEWGVMDNKNCHTAVKGDGIQQAIDEWDGDTERKAEYDFDGTCPDCGSSNWNHGPEACMSRNMECANCGSQFNYHPVFETIERIG